MLAALEQTRLRLSKQIEAGQKSRLGQFFTPARTAAFMAGLFQDTPHPRAVLLDAGAGIGSLSCAFFERCMQGGLNINEIHLSAYELDESLHSALTRSLSGYLHKIPMSFDIFGGDFIAAAVNEIQRESACFTHAVLNPPYKKIGSRSSHRLLLRSAGIETVNLYSAFVAAALLLMAPGGQLVAIVPRSFCNGPYYRPFRDFLFQHAAIGHLHLFGSRNKAFQDDRVLQENIILRLERGACQGPVHVSSSTDDSFRDLSEQVFPFEQIVIPNDPERFIHIPAPCRNGASNLSSMRGCSLDELGIHVSTGPIVDFRLKEHLRLAPEADTVPLLYPAHFRNHGVLWPMEGTKKPNAIQRNSSTEKWLYPTGFYCVVRRFSSKEEKRRIVASVVNPAVFAGAPKLGFENHLNVFHAGKRGLPAALAHGLAAFLNTPEADDHFRRFSGHTQVNASDLKRLNYPSREALIDLGECSLQKRSAQ